MLKPVRKLTRVPAFDGTTATFIGTLMKPDLMVTPAANASATPAGVTFGPTPELRAFPRSQAHEPADTWKRNALIQASKQQDPFVHDRDSAVLRVELIFELPAELGDRRTDVDLTIAQLVDHAVAERGESEPGT
jgi:hypothetical protein